MAKVGRNDPCPCGSEKKFKKCHGSVVTQQPQLPIRPWGAGTKAPPLNAEMNMIGLPGKKHHLVMRALSSDPNNPINAGGPGGLTGKYKVIFTLSRPGYSPLTDRHFSVAAHLKGDSHLAIAKPALAFLDGEEFDLLRFGLTTPFGQFVFTGFPNDKGLLGKVESEPFDANHFGDAALKAHQAIAVAFSTMSVHLDVPVHVHQMDVVEMRTGSVRISVTAPFRDIVGWLPPIDNASEEQQKYASLYREALNSNSSNYQFLCWYRVIEGLRERRQRIRGQAAIEAKARGESPPSYPEEKIPNDKAEQIKWLDSLYTKPQPWDDLAIDSIFLSEVVDRRIRNLIDKGEELHKLRNKIAHAVLDSGEPMISIDNGMDIEEVEKWLPITKFIARHLLKDAFPGIFKSN